MCTKVTFEKVLPAITVSPVMLAWFDAPRLPMDPAPRIKGRVMSTAERKYYYGSRYSKASTCRVCGHSGR